MKRIKKQELAIIEWTDAAMHGTEQISRSDAAHELNLIAAVTAGLVVHEDKKKITLAMDWFHVHDQFRQIASYPKSGISKITREILQPVEKEAE